MKKNLFVMAALAVLAIGCAKEQQPDVQNPADVKKTYLHVSVDDTKVAVNSLNGVCSWQEGDVLAAWFVTEQETVTGDDGKETQKDVAGVRVEFTYESDNEDGSARFATTENIPEFIYAKAAYPATSLNSTGGFTLTRDYTYDPDSVPVYVRDYSVTKNEDGTLSSNLVHNASVMKFTLHDIPAYAAGFVLESTTSTQTIKITTSFPYKTGYDQDITLHSVVGQGSVPTKFYLIDGEGAVIEGTEKKFKEATPVDTKSYIDMGTVDFQKANLRKDYTVVGGVKWAKGNLQYDADDGQDGFQSGWRIAPYQWHNFRYAEASKETPTQYTYTNSTAEYEHFNFGGLGRFPKFKTGNMTPSAAMDISGKVYSDIEGKTEAEGDARFVENNGSSATIWGDVAFWASKGTFRMPTNTEMKVLHNGSDKLLGYYKTSDGKIVWGVLFRTKWFGTRETNTTYDRVFTDADLESGLFLPNAGRRTNSTSGTVINVATQGAYRSSAYIGQKSDSDLYYPSYFQAEFKPTSGNPYAKLFDAVSTMGDAFDSTAGFCIRPILVE